MYKNTCFGRRGGCLSEVDIGYDQLSDKDNWQSLNGGISVTSLWNQCGSYTLAFEQCDISVCINVAVVSDNLCSFPGFCIFGFSRYHTDDGDDDEDHDGVDDDCDDHATTTPFLNDNLRVMYLHPGAD